MILALAASGGCKSMGGLGSGLGHLASGLGHVASGVGRVAGAVGHVTGSALAHTGSALARTGPALGRGVGHVAPVLSNVARHALPILETIAEAATLQVDPDDPPEIVEQTTTEDGPLIDDHDPCGQCAEDLPCEACAGFGNFACRLTPPGAFARCESTAPLLPPPTAGPPG
jgi:hypothetical protein